MLSSSWLFHPFSINISTRGNADSIVALLVLLTVLLVMRKQLVLAALTYDAAPKEEQWHTQTTLI